jgi:F-type H+-transporting ATPase subunit gamma
VAEIVERLLEAYDKAEIDSVYVIYNEFKSVISQRLIAQRILPVQEIGRREVLLTEEFTLEERERMGEAAKAAGISLKEPEETEAVRRAKEFPAPGIDYIYEQPAEEIFHGMLPRYVILQLFQAMLESVAAEQAARMTAMDSATNNANDVIDSLTLTMNRARQAAITKEIIEIVSGAAAL